jgi:hypothetical protein
VPDLQVGWGRCGAEGGLHPTTQYLVKAAIDDGRRALGLFRGWNYELKYE